MRKFFPEPCEECGEEALLDAIRLGIARAARHGIDSGPDVARYITLMFFLGSDFVADPKFPWAREILEDPAADEESKIERLKATALEVLDRSEGRENEFLEQALRRLREQPLEVLLPPRGEQDFVAYMRGNLERLQPQRCAAIGDQALDALIERAVREAGKRGIRDEQGLGIYVGLAFMLGAGFATDPLYPWLRPIFDDHRDARATKAYRLYRAALSHSAGEAE